jgi:hypothetical protein
MLRQIGGGVFQSAFHIRHRPAPFVSRRQQSVLTCPNDLNWKSERIDRKIDSLETPVPAMGLADGGPGGMVKTDRYGCMVAGW